MIRIPKRVIKRWREITTDPDMGDPFIELLLTSRLAPEEAVVPLGRALSRAVGAFELSHPEPVVAGEEPPFAGEWEVLAVPEGALLAGGRKSDADEQMFTEFLDEIAAGLGREKVNGTLDLYARPPTPSPPSSIGLIRARIQVERRRQGEPRSVWWDADREALERVVASAVRWCLAARPDVAVTLQRDATPHLVLKGGYSALERVLAVMYTGFTTRLHSIAHDRYRAIAVDSGNGRLSLVEGGLRLHRDGWQPAVVSIQTFLHDRASDLVYGHLARSHTLGEGLHPESYQSDRHFTRNASAIAQADHLAPDAYAIQLPGPRYTPNIPRHPDWRVTALPAGRTLLSHVDLPAWLDEITLRAALHDQHVPRDQLRAQARETLASILIPRPSLAVRQRTDQ